ncbi:MAG: flagellar motor protein MotB [Rickettsiaceae bacterium]|nr:flagellar motor protein MotB [Rickettsiaceae bacterium]
MAEEKAPEEKKHTKNIIIIKKVKKHHDEHHGGAWKVAYADFVTAMMAFFLLMWLINTVSTDQLRGIAAYFMPEIGLEGSNGTGFDGHPYSSPTSRALDTQASKEALANGSAVNDYNDKREIYRERIIDSDAAKLISVMNNLEQNMDGSGEISKFKDNLIIEKTPEGIKIQIVDSLSRSVFKPGTAEVQPYMNKFLYIISELIKTVPNYISIEGHTAKEYDNRAGQVDQWDLSIQRANVIRKFYQNRIKPDQILRVEGHADTAPYDFKDLTSPKNSRIVIILLNTNTVGKLQSPVPTN